MPDLGSATFSQTDGSNDPLGSAAPNTIDNNIRETKGALTREWNWRSFTVAATGTADAKVLTYSVAPAAYYNGQRFAFVANTVNTGSCTLNVNSLGAKVIKSMLTGSLVNLAGGEMLANTYVEVSYNTANDCFVWINQLSSNATSSAAGIVELATTTETITGTDTARAVTPDALAALWEQGANVASAATVSLGEGGYFLITGTTTITDIDFATDAAGRTAWVRFNNVLTLTHNATTLILPGGANITTAQGDVACFVSEGSDVVRCTVYTRANGRPVTTSGAELLGSITTTSGASATLGSLNLTDYSALELHFYGVSHNNGTSTTFLVGNSTSDDVSVTLSAAAGIALTGRVFIQLVNGIGISILGDEGGAASVLSFDTALSTATTTISVAPGAGSFDAGIIRVWGFK